MKRFHVAVGSNLGPREAHLYRATKQLAEDPALRLLRVSTVFETSPVGPRDQPDYLNLVIVGEATCDADSLLDRFQAIERSAGRVRGRRWGERTLDLDLLLWGDEVISNPRLTVPHTELAQRRFVLVPLVEVDPGVRHPVLGRSAAELLEACPDRGRVQRWGSVGWPTAVEGKREC